MIWYDKYIYIAWFLYKKGPTSSSKAEKSKMDQIKPKVKSVSAFKKIDSDNLFAKEEEYK